MDDDLLEVIFDLIFGVFKHIKEKKSDLKTAKMLAERNTPKTSGLEDDLDNNDKK